ncbi:MAG: glycosyltransferase family 4 protein [bacterium]
MKIILFTYRSQNPPSTFIKQHIDYIAGGYENFMQLYDWKTPMLGHKPLWSGKIFSRVKRKILVKIGRSREDLHRQAFKKGLRKSKADAVLAEFGYSGAFIWGVCKELNIPLTVHFHGTEINRKELFKKYISDYKLMFKHVNALITVSSHEKKKLIDIGADRSKIKVIPCGALFPSEYNNRKPSGEICNIITVTRMVEVKSPHLTILAFQKYLKMGGKGMLHVVGDGPLLPVCKSLAKALSVDNNIIFYGRLTHENTLPLYRQSDMYIQHSVEAEDGDCEGMPVTIMEAAGYGLPIVTTAAGGITEYIEHEKTGYIVEQYDIDSMAKYMLKIWSNKDQSEKLGKAAFDLARDRFNAGKQSEKVKKVVLSTLYVIYP